MARYDNNLVVIGGGSAGLISAYIAATVRARVTLIEAGRMGGDCLNTGCVPSKTLIASARVAHTMRHAERFGIRAIAPEVDFAAVMERVRNAIATIAPKDSMDRYRSLGVDCVAGRARLLDPHHVEVDGRRISSR
ncbi:MAG: FAD-dependent oxidoreductase, partial [Pseudomonadales bacterium]